MTMVIDVTGQSDATILAGVVPPQSNNANRYQQTEAHILGILNTSNAELGGLTSGKEIYGYQMFNSSTSVAGEELEVGASDITTLGPSYQDADLLDSETLTSVGPSSYATVLKSTPIPLADGLDIGCVMRSISTSIGLTRQFSTNAGRFSSATGATALENPFNDGGSNISQNYSVAVLIRDASSPTPTLSDVGGDDTVAVGDNEAVTYANFTSAIESATINDGASGTVALTVSSAGATSAVLSLASMDDWVKTNTCPFTSASHTSQQVTITSTDEDPDEEASLSVTFNPESGYEVVELTSVTWPAPDGSLYKGFSEAPNIGDQFIHNLGAGAVDPVDAIVTTDVLTDQTEYYYNSVTGEGGSFLYLVEALAAGFDASDLLSSNLTAADLVAKDL